MKHARFFIGLTAIILLYAGCTVEADEEPPRPIVLEISNLPTKVSYEKGEKLNLNGLKVKLYKTDGSFEVLKEGKYTAEPKEGTELTAPGEKTVTITAEGLSKTVPITVAAPEEKPDVSAVGLEISKQPTKAVYKKGDELDLSGLEVTLKKSDGTSEVLAEYTAEPENGSELTRLGKQPVTITAEGLSATFTITVTAPEEKPDVSAVELVISEQPTKTVYKKGDELDLNGLEVTLKRPDGTSEVFTAYTTEPEDGSELTRLGKQAVAIMAEGLETTFDICVAGLEILQLPETDYTFYVPLDLSGLEVKRYNTDGTSEVLEQYVTEPEDKSILAEIGKLPVTITAGELTETFEISVSDEYVVVDDNENHILMKVPDKVKEKAVNITVPESIVRIENSVFTGCQSLSEIKLLGSVAKGFGSQAFEGFSGVVRVANGDTSFLNCISLKRVVIEKGVTTIGPEAFYGCQKLTSIDIPDSVTTIGMGAFSSCENLKSVTYGGSKKQWNKIGVCDRKGVPVGTMETELEDNRVGLGLGDRTIVYKGDEIKYEEVIYE